VFLNPVGFAAYVVHSGASRACNIDALFFMLRRALCDFHEKDVGKCYVELVFLHLVGSVGHVVHYGASRAWNLNTLFFMLWLLGAGYIKTTSRRGKPDMCFLHPVGSAGHVVHTGHEISIHYFSCWGGTSVYSKTSVTGHVTLNVFSIWWDLRVT
jgi:hypothetical protein